MLCSFGSIHDALQCRAHKPQLLHLEVSITGLKAEKREINPNTVPTGPTGQICITLGATISPSQKEKNNESNDRNDKSSSAFAPYIYGIKGITIHLF